MAQFTIHCIWLSFTDPYLVTLVIEVHKNPGSVKEKCLSSKCLTQLAQSKSDHVCLFQSDSVQAVWFNWPSPACTKSRVTDSVQDVWLSWLSPGWLIQASVQDVSRVEWASLGQFWSIGRGEVTNGAETAALGERRTTRQVTRHELLHLVHTRILVVMDPPAAAATVNSINEPEHSTLHRPAHGYSNSSHWCIYTKLWFKLIKQSRVNLQPIIA